MPWLEPEMEAFLKRRVPGIETRWRGADTDEIQEIEDRARQPLPKFYQWFLHTLGGNIGDVARSFDGFRAKAVQDAYAQGIVAHGPPLLFLGRKPDPIMPLDVYYDLSQTTRDDALVLTQPAGDTVFRKAAETLREYLAWSVMNVHGVGTFQQRCRGMVKDAGSDVTQVLTSVLDTLGFRRPIPTGPYCALFERPDADLSGAVAAEPHNKHLLVFTLGSHDAANVRTILGNISTASRLDVSVTEWDPPLPR